MTRRGRAVHVHRVVVLGSESTGSTTLAGDLARRLDVPWVPEYLREYAIRKASAAGSIWDVEWTSDDFVAVAVGQEALEAEAIATAGAQGAPGAPYEPLVVCDNDLLAVAVWHYRYVGAPAPALLARVVPPLLYVLTPPGGVPFEQDGLRDGEHVREPMTDWFRQALAAQPAPWIEAVAHREERVEQVVSWLAAPRRAPA